MKLIHKFIITLVICLFSFSVYAGANLKIGIINPKKLFSDSPQAKKAEKALKKEFSSRNDKVNKLRKDLESKANNYKKDQQVLSQKERLKTEKEINRLRQDFQRMASELDIDIKVKRNEILAEFDKDFKEVVNEIAKKEKFDLILPDQIIIYGARNMDITDKVLKVLKKKFK